jgi:hypothetical protein
MKTTDTKEVLLEVLNALLALELKLWKANDGTAAAGVVMTQRVVINLLSDSIGD